MTSVSDNSYLKPRNVLGLSYLRIKEMIIRSDYATYDTTSHSGEVRGKADEDSPRAHCARPGY